MTKPSDSTKNKGQNDNDRTTEVYRTGNHSRVTFSFKCDPELKKAFIEHCKAEYGSVCHVLEPVMYSILFAKVYLSRTLKTEQPQSQPVVIENLTVERVVQRHRRIYREEQGERRANFFSDGHWLHFDGELNHYGHIVGCKCHWCAPLKPRKRVT